MIKKRGQNVLNTVPKLAYHPCQQARWTEGRPPVRDMDGLPRRFFVDQCRKEAVLTLDNLAGALKAIRSTLALHPSGVLAVRHGLKAEFHSNACSPLRVPPPPVHLGGP